MKLNKLSTALILSASATLLLAGCSADDGNNGLGGKDGSNGIDGANGAGQVIAIERIGRTASQGFAVSAAEIVDFDKTQKRIFAINANSGKVDVFTGADVTNPTLFLSIDLKQLLVDNGKAANTTLVGAANSVAVFGNYAAVAVEANPKTDNGWLVFLNTSDLSFANAVQVGALPDMVTFTSDGSKVLVANEGEPNVGYTVDPEGTVSIVTVAGFVVNTVNFTDFNTAGSRNSELPSSKMIIDGYNATVAKSFEPEYIAVSDDNSKAYVGLQENNAIAVINLSNNTIDKIIGLGFKDHSIPGNEMDASQKDGVNIKTWPVMGMYMPDSIKTMTYNGKTYLVTANEGDSREDWLNGINSSVSCAASGYYHASSKCRDELSLKDLATSDMTLGTALTGLNTDTTLGRLKFSYFATKAKNSGSALLVNKIYAYGGRSFSIWDATTGVQVFDSGSDFELITAQKYGTEFNNDNSVNESDGRSDNKGPEPEALTMGKINGHTYAFIGLERMGGIMVYDVSNPFAPQYIQYVNDRDLTISPSSITDAGDLGPEGFRFVSAEDSPNGKPLLLVANEVSGTTAIYAVNTTLLQGQ